MDEGYAEEPEKKRDREGRGISGEVPKRHEIIRVLHVAAELLISSTHWRRGQAWLSTTAVYMPRVQALLSSVERHTPVLARYVSSSKAALQYTKKITGNTESGHHHRVGEDVMR